MNRIAALALLAAAACQAQTDTKIIVRDGGSIIIQPEGLDDGTNWTLTKAEVRHRNNKGVLKSLQISDAGTSVCAGTTCGIDPLKPWKVQIRYGTGFLTISTTSSNTGIHFTHRNLPFDQWAKGGPDEREFGHGDGKKISSVTINNGPVLCAGKGCQITLLYTPK